MRDAKTTFRSGMCLRRGCQDDPCGASGVNYPASCVEGKKVGALPAVFNSHIEINESRYL